MYEHPGAPRRHPPDEVAIQHLRDIRAQNAKDASHPGFGRLKMDSRARKGVTAQRHDSKFIASRPHLPSPHGVVDDGHRE